MTRLAQLSQQGRLWPCLFSASVLSLLFVPVEYATTLPLNTNSAEVPVPGASLLSPSHRALSPHPHPGVPVLPFVP